MSRTAETCHKTLHLGGGASKTGHGSGAAQHQLIALAWRPREVRDGGQGKAADVGHDVLVQEGKARLASVVGDAPVVPPQIPPPGMCVLS